MAEEPVEQPLTREECIPNFILPTGRKLDVLPVLGSNLFEIKFVDDKSGSVPKEYQGKYTGPTLARRALEKYVTEFWDMSDSTPSKSRKPPSSFSTNNNAISR